MSSRAHDPTLLDVILAYGVDPRARRVMLHGNMEQHQDNEYGKVPIDFAINGLLYLDKFLGDPIELWICSTGGSVIQMFALYDVIRTRRNPVITIGTGAIHSAGVLILAAGDRRYMTENATLMSHSGHGENRGDIYTRTTQLAADVRDEKRWAELMARHTKKNQFYWENLHKPGAEGAKPELWMGAKQAKQFGIIDEVLKEGDVPE